MQKHSTILCLSLCLATLNFRFPIKEVFDRVFDYHWESKLLLVRPRLKSISFWHLWIEVKLLLWQVFWILNVRTGLAECHEIQTQKIISAANLARLKMFFKGTQSNLEPMLHLLIDEDRMGGGAIYQTRTS